MNKQELRKLIEKGESRNLEFKESLSLKNEIGESVSGFANTCDGMILIGVSDEGEVKGVQIGKKTIEQLANFIKQNTDNSVYPDIGVERVDGKDIIVVKIKESDEKPVFFRGDAYVRVGKSNHKLSASEIRRMAKESSKSYWDGQVCEGAELSDIDLDFIEKEFIPLYLEASGKKVIGKIKELLNSLGCIKDNKPTNAGILLFGKNPQKFFMNSYIALARYKGDVESSERLDYKEFSENLFQQIDRCNDYIKDHIAIMSRLKLGEVRREDISEYGLFSIRELITNAICHRDYSDQRSKVIIKMFDEKIDFYNPGGFGGNVTPKNVVYRQYSRNPVIAKVLSKVEYIEELGEGWNKIIKEHEEHSLKPELPKIVADKSSVLISLFSTKEKFEEKDLIKDLIKDLKDLTENQRKILFEIRKDSRVTQEQLSKIIGINEKNIRNNIAILRKKDLLKRAGGRKRGYWKIVKDDR